MPNIENEKYEVYLRDYEFTDAEIVDETFCSELDEEDAELAEDVLPRSFTASNSKFVGCTFLVDDLWEIELNNCEFANCTFRSQDPNIFIAITNDWRVLRCKFYNCEFSDFEKKFGAADACEFYNSKFDDVTVRNFYLGSEKFYGCKLDDVSCDRATAKNLLLHECKFDPEEGIELTKCTISILRVDYCEDVSVDAIDKMNKDEATEIDFLYIDGNDRHHYFHLGNLMY